MEQFPDAVVVGSKVCLAFLSNLMHQTFKQQAVKGGDKVRQAAGQSRRRVAWRGRSVQQAAHCLCLGG